jgi:stringent starvation protein B
MMDARSQEKRRQLERALERGRVMIHLDARRPGVVVPERFRSDFHLRLNLSLRFDPPDLTVSEWGVRETLSFGGVRSSVAVPWSAIFAITGAERSEQPGCTPRTCPASSSRRPRASSG